jgi:hypothetical protein
VRTGTVGCGRYSSRRCSTFRHRSWTTWLPAASARAAASSSLIPSCVQITPASARSRASSTTPETSSLGEGVDRNHVVAAVEQVLRDVVGVLAGGRRTAHDRDRLPRENRTQFLVGVDWHTRPEAGD